MILRTIASIDTISARFVTAGAAGRSAPRGYNRWKEEVGVPIYQVYGATERGFTCLSPLDTEPVPGGLPGGPFLRGP